MRYLLAAVLLVVSAGVAAAAPPSYDKLAKLPVIRLGDPVPKGDYILQFPARQPVYISVTIEGTLFAQGADTVLTVTPAADILVYQDWASLDGVKWAPKSELIRSDVDVKVPGYNHPYPGVLKVRMDLAK